MPTIELKPLADLGVLTSLYSDPYIARVGHDHRPASPVAHPSARYLGAYVDGTFVGAFLLIESGYIEIDVHALLSRKALPHSRRLGRLCLSMAFSDASIERVTAYVIENLRSAANYCRKLGFQFEGARRAACMKDGELLGVQIFGMTRNEWEATK